MKNLYSFSLLLLFFGALLIGGTSCNSSAKAGSAAGSKKTVDPNKINWMTFEQVQKKMKKQPKKIFVDVYTEWCGPCKMMDRNTFSKPEIAQYVNDNFYAVKFNAQHETPIKFNGTTYANPNYDPAKGQKRRNASHQLSKNWN